MVKKEVIDWVNIEKSKGINDFQIKQAMSKQGYSNDEINEAFLNLSKKDNNSFNEFLTKKGDFFRFLIYSFINFSAAAMLSFIWITTIPYFLGLLDTNFYVLTLIYIFIAGLILAYVSDKISDTSGVLIFHAISYSSILSFMISFNSILITPSRAISDKISEINSIATESGGMGGYLNLFNNTPIDIRLFFIFSFLLFNIFFLFYYFKRDKKNYFALLTYVIPIIIFVSFYLLFTFLSNMIAEAIIALFSSMLPAI